MTKRIAIVGGGFVGFELAKSLETLADVTLIEQNSHFVLTTAMIRAVIDPSLLDRGLIPYDNLLKHGKIVQARAESVDKQGVVLDNGDRIEADYVVVATGSSHALPFRPKGNDIEGLRAGNGAIHNKLIAANSVAIVGAGAVGTELAGEIAHFMPEKSVTLISSDANLFPAQPSGFGRALERKLRAAGVQLILGARAENLESMTDPYSGNLTLSNGQDISADLIFPAVGSRANSDLIADLPGAEKSTAGRVRVDGWMRPSSFPNVFAAGDAADMGDAMTVVATARQLPWLKKTMRAVLSGQKLEDQKPYKPWNKAPILVPLGPEKGNSFLSLFTVGNAMTRLMKGKDLFLSKYNKALGR